MPPGKISDFIDGSSVSNCVAGGWFAHRKQSLKHAPEEIFRQFGVGDVRTSDGQRVRHTKSARLPHRTLKRFCRCTFTFGGGGRGCGGVRKAAQSQRRSDLASLSWRRSIGWGADVECDLDLLA